MHLDQQPLNTKRTLGLEWDSESDCFVFVVEGWQGDSTRRSLLSYVASVFDPLGLVAPCVLPSKLLIQDLTRRKAEWDETMTPDEISRWKYCLRELQSVQRLRINRCLSSPALEGIAKSELHAFSDASEIGYGATVYLRIFSSGGGVKCSLLMAKSRVAPLKSVTIPRMELAGAVLSVKLVNFVKEELTIPLNSVTFWTDSVVVLHYIRNRSTRFDVYTSNRLTFIREHSQVEQWFYVETKRNPADLASRGTTAKRELDDM